MQQNVALQVARKVELFSTFRFVNGGWKLLETRAQELRI